MGHIKTYPPIIAFHGLNDTVVSVKNTKMLYNSLREIGITHMEIKIYKSLRHSSSITSHAWIYDLEKWLKEYKYI